MTIYFGSEKDVELENLHHKITVLYARIGGMQNYINRLKQGKTTIQDRKK